MNFKVFFFAVFMCCLVFCGNPQYIYALDNLPSMDDCRSNFTNGMNRLESDSNFARDLFNHKVCYVNPDRDNSFMDLGNVSSPAQYLAIDSSPDQYSNLKDAVKYSKPGDTIFLKPGNYSGENNTNITINHDLNIVGLSPVPERVNNTNNTSLDDLINSTNDTGIIIDGKGENSFFNILGSCTVTLGNLTLINAYSSGDGAAICNSGKLLIDTSFIKNNVVKSDRFADRDAMGGAIYNSGDLSLDYVTCEGNNATGYSRGGAIFNTGTMNINNSAFCNNSAGSGGGAIYSISTLGSMYFNCFFAYNKAGSESGESGGAIYNEGDGLSVVLSTFVNNTGDNGGAIDIFNSVLSLEYSDFVFNNARVDGGAVRIRNGKQQSVQDCNFANNTANNGAGLYYSDGEKLSIDGGSFTENMAVNDGGGISLKKGELSLNRTSVTHNTCFGRGGGIYNYDSDVVLNNLSVMFNVGSSGAGLYTTGEGKRSVDLMYGVFSDNFALGDGGAVYADTNSRFIASHGVFSANHAENGGGIYSRNNLVIDDGGFINNTCSGDGAGLNLQGDMNSIIGSLFSDNEAAGSGGGIYNGGGVDCHDCLLYNNSAGVDGGALFIGGGDSSFYHDQFESNRCGGYGGAVFSDVSNSFPELMNDFRGNTAGKDGDDFITASDKAVKANAGIIGYAISAFLIAVVATVVTIASCGAAGPASLTGAAAFFANLGISLGWGLVASGVEFGVTELIAAVDVEFDDYRKEHPGIMTSIGIAMAIIGSISGMGIAKLIARFGTGPLAQLLKTSLTGEGLNYSNDPRFKLGVRLAGEEREVIIGGSVQGLELVQLSDEEIVEAIAAGGNDFSLAKSYSLILEGLRNGRIPIKLGYCGEDCFFSGYISRGMFIRLASILQVQYNYDNLCLVAQTWVTIRDILFEAFSSPIRS